MLPCFPNKLLFPACWAVTMENHARQPREPLGSAGCAHPGLPLPFSAIAGSRSGAGGWRGAVPAGQGPGAAAARCVHALQSTGKGAAAPLSSAGRAQTKGSLLLRVAAGRAAPGCSPGKWGDCKGKPPGAAPRVLWGAGCPWSVLPPNLGGVPTGRAGGPTAGSGRSPGRELFLLPRPRSAKRPLLPVRWQLRPPSWLQAPCVLGVLAGRTQKGFLQRRTPQWLLSFIASAREIHVYCNFFFFGTCASQIARINS